MIFRTRTAHKPESVIRIRIDSETPDAYKTGCREYLLTINQAHRLLEDLHHALEHAPAPEDDPMVIARRP